MTTEPFQALASSCQEAVRHLRERRPEVAVVAVEGDWAFVSVGHIEVGRIAALYRQDRALGIIRVPKVFPDGTRPYGIVTVPYLERTDGKDIPSQRRSHENAKPVEEALGVDDTGFWSWKWEGIKRDAPEHLKKAPDLVRKRLRMEGD